MQEAQRALARVLAEVAEERRHLAHEAQMLDAAQQTLTDLQEQLGGAGRAADGAAVARLRELRGQLTALRERGVRARSDRLRQWADGIGRSADSLRRMASLATLGELSASVAHEIRNPLCGIQLLVEVLQTKMDAGDSRNVLLESLRRETERMAKVVDNLLHFARHYEPRLAVCTLEDVVHRSVDCVRSHLKKKQIEVIVDGSPLAGEVEADADLLLQVFKNILLNSVDASPEGSAVHVHLRPTDGGEGVAVTFRDEGEGIEPDVIGRVFDPFFTSKSNGVGLGLSVSKKIVGAHHGRIEVESEPGNGTTFTVVLPGRPGDEQQRLAA